MLAEVVTAVTAVTAVIAGFCHDSVMIHGYR